MNIAIFASAYHPHVGGVEELSRQLAKEYQRRGMGAIVVTNRWPRNLPEREVLEGVSVYRIAMRVPEGGARVWLNYSLTHRGIRRELLRILGDHAIDVLHIQCVSSNGLYALHAKRALGLPLVTTLQGELTMDASGLYERSAYARGLLREVMDESEVITACSRKTLEDGERFYGRAFGERGRVIFNGASVEDFSGGEAYAHPRPYVLALGRMVPQKGIDVLLRAYAIAEMAGHDLIVAGDGPELEGLKALAQALGLAKRVHFVGRADRGKVVALFHGASFFVLPSRADEGLPVVCAEAMAAGKALIATRSGGVPEALVGGRHGILVEKEDIHGLAAALTRMAGDDAMRERFGTLARERASMFGWGRIADEYVELYEAVRAGRRETAGAA